MGRYRLVFKRSVTRDLRDLPKEAVARLLKCFEMLSEDPRVPGCEKMSGRDECRFRQGAYRIIYEIKDEVLTIVVVKVGHRRGVYKLR